MVDHSLGIRRFHSRIALAGLREEGPGLGAEVSRAVRELLPAAAGRALEPLLGSREGVLRIDRIALKLRLERRGLSAARLADALAQQIAEAVAQRAEGGTALPRVGPGFAYWPDHSSYAAAYVASRLGLASAPDWAFPDLQALAQLSPQEVARELIGARPAVLSALARQLGRGAAGALAARLGEATVAALVARLAAEAPGALPEGALAEIATLLAELPAGPGDVGDGAVIAAACSMLAGRPAQDATQVSRLLLLARIAGALAAVRAAAPTAWGPPAYAADLRPKALAVLPEPVRRVAQAVLAPLTGDGATRAALARLLGAAPTLPVAVAASAEPAEPARAIASMLAGIGLLLPAALAHDLPGLLSPAALHHALVAAAGPEAARLARLDPVIGALAPFDPRGPAAAFPPVPDGLRAAAPTALREGEAAAEGAAGWAACLTHAFAAELAGFEASTLPYLRRQFLLRPGTLHLADDQMTLVLDPLPLGILLRLRGPHGWVGRLPQAGGAWLRIEVTESRA